MPSTDIDGRLIVILTEPEGQAIWHILYAARKSGVTLSDELKSVKRKLERDLKIKEFPEPDLTVVRRAQEQDRLGKGSIIDEILNGRN